MKQLNINYLRIMVYAGILLAFPAFGRDDRVPGSRYTSGRGAAMGDAFIPFADDGAASLFYNPAGLGKLKATTVEPLNFSIQPNSDYFGAFDRNFYKVTSLSSYGPTVDSHAGLNPGLGGAIFPNFSTRGFGFGVLAQSQFHAQSDGAGNITYRSLYQLIPTFGAGVRLASGVLRLGYSLQWVNKAVGQVTVPLSSTIGYNQSLTQGSALSHTLGAALTFPVAYLPSLNVVARNVLGAKYSATSIYPFSSSSTGAPPNEPMTLDAAVAVQSKMGQGIYMNFALEYRDMTNQSSTAILGRLVSGAEFSFKDQFFLRGGWGSGYPSAGAGLRRKSADVSLTWYSEELGSGYHSQKDTKFMMQYQIRMF